MRFALRTPSPLGHSSAVARDEGLEVHHGKACDKFLARARSRDRGERVGLPERGVRVLSAERDGLGVQQPIALDRVHAVEMRVGLLVDVHLVAVPEVSLMRAFGCLRFERFFTCLAVTGAEEVGRWLDVVSQERHVQAGGIPDARFSHARDDVVAPFKLSKNIPRRRQAAEEAAGLRAR